MTLGIALLFSPIPSCFVPLLPFFNICQYTSFSFHYSPPTFFIPTPCTRCPKTGLRPPIPFDVGVEYFCCVCWLRLATQTRLLIESAICSIFLFKPSLSLTDAELGVCFCLRADDVSMLGALFPSTMKSPFNCCLTLVRIPY